MEENGSETEHHNGTVSEGVWSLFKAFRVCLLQNIPSLEPNFGEKNWT